MSAVILEAREDPLQVRDWPDPEPIEMAVHDVPAACAEIERCGVRDRGS